jgi:signal transduction histidine kinase
MIRPLRLSVSTLAFNYVALSFFVLAVIATPIWYAWSEVIDEGRTQILVADMRRLTNVFNQRGKEALVAAIESRIGDQPAEDEKYYLLADPALVPIVGNLPVWPRELPLTWSGPDTVEIRVDNQLLRAVLIRTTLAGGYQLLVGRNTAYHQQLEQLFIFVLAGATGVILLLGALSGLLIRRALLSEVNRINLTTSAIVAGDLSRRLSARSGNHELNMLAQTVNRMLDQIEQLIQGVRNVSNAIAHDLRTPLTELRFGLENLSRTRPAPDHTFAEIDTAVADVDRVIAIFNALLRLAEIDTGARRSGFVQVDLAQVAGDAAEFYQPVAELKGVTLTCNQPGELIVPGDPLLLAQAISNLIDNALKFVPENGVISVTAAQGEDLAISVTVADDGPGIADGEKSKVTERFYRSDASRGTPGVGLGLSLVAAVANLHGGNLALTDNAPGLRATLTVSSPASAHVFTLKSTAQASGRSES